MDGPQNLRLVLVGFGAVNKTLMSILQEKGPALLERHKLQVYLVAASDSGGATVCTAGLDVPALLEHKAGKRSVVEFPGGKACAGAAEMLAVVDGDYDVLVDGSPVQLKDGGVGLSSTRTALRAGKRAVLANKAPLVLALDELTQLATEGPPGPPRLLYSAAVCGGLPVVNVGRRDLSVAATKFKLVEGVFNSTTNYILSAMASGQTFNDALAEAQRLGIAEADPSLDVDGWDTANKLVIIANSVLGKPVRLSDIQVEGIRAVSPKLIADAKDRGEVHKLVARAQVMDSGELQLSVRPTLLKSTEFLAGVRGWEMGIVFHSDLFEVISMKIDESSVVPTSAAVLRDILHCAGR